MSFWSEIKFRVGSSNSSCSAKQMKKLKYCSLVLADHKRTYTTLKRGKYHIFSTHRKSSGDEPVNFVLQA